MSDLIRFHSDAPVADVLRIVASDGEVLLRLSVTEPSYVDESRLGEAAQMFLDEVVRLAAGMGLPLLPSSS